MKTTLKEAIETNFFVEEGTVEFKNNSLLILTSSAKKLQEINKDYLNTLLQDAEKKINDKYTIVNTILEETSKNPEIKIDWRIYTKNPKRPLIRDLIVEGLSLARTQKEEFKSILKNNNGDISYLFKSLEEFIIK